MSDRQGSIRDCARLAALVRESRTFFIRERSHAPGIHVYRPRAAAEARIAIRHNGGDGATLDEVFGRRWYHPPREVARALGRPGRILDLGANVGLFGAFATALWPLATVLGYEPDPASYVVHQRALAANGRGERWRVLLAAAGASEERVRFAAHGNPSSAVLEADQSDTQETVVPQHDVLAQIARCDLVKIDIEGGEWAIIGDPRFGVGPPRAVILEYHAAGCPGADAREAALAFLAEAGMRTVPLPETERDGAGMVWALRETRRGISRRAAPVHQQAAREPASDPSTAPPKRAIW